MYVRLKRSVQHLVYSRNRTECMNATRRFNHSRWGYVRKKVAYIELLFLCRLDRAILWKGLDNLHSFLEFPFGHGGSKTLSDADNDNRWWADAKLDPKFPGPKPTHGPSQPSYDDPEQPNPFNSAKQLRFAFQGERKERQCV